MEEDENAPTPLRIAAIRKQRKMTQKQLAAAADVPLRTLKAWEKEKQPDALPVVLRIARVLEVSLDQLAGEPDRDAPPPRAPQVFVDGVAYVPASAEAGPGAIVPPTRESGDLAAARANDAVAHKRRPRRPPRPPDA